MCLNLYKASKIRIFLGASRKDLVTYVLHERIILGQENFVDQFEKKGKSKWEWHKIDFKRG